MGHIGVSRSPRNAWDLHRVRGVFMGHMGVPESPWGAWDLHVSHRVSMERTGVPGSPWNALGFHGTHGGPWISMGYTRPSRGTRAPCVLNGYQDPWISMGHTGWERSLERCEAPKLWPTLAPSRCAVRQANIWQGCGPEHRLLCLLPATRAHDQRG